MNKGKVKFVQRLASQLVDAKVRSSMAGLGGCKEFDLEDFDEEFHQFILKYITDEICSVEAMLLAAELFDEKALTKNSA